jgi:threonine/homoserine/homoserine lactone efflux protein
VSESVLAFAGVAALVTISPGADMALVARSALIDGRAAAFATTLGICLGLVVWAVASAVGLAALLAASATAFLVVKIAGAAYLVGLGLWTIARGLRGRTPPSPPPVAVRARRGAAFREGFISNLLNPKIAIFYTTVLPQFIAPGDPALAVSLVLVAVHVCFSLAWLSLYAYALSGAGALLRRPSVRRALDCVTGAVLAGLGARLAFVER